MTKQQFIDQFYLRMDKAATNALAGVEVEELESYATQAQEELVIERMSPKINRKKEGLEETEKRVQDLGQLVRNATITSFANGFLPNSFVATLPNTLSVLNTDYSDVHWFTIFERATLNKLDCDGNNYIVRVRSVTHQELNYLLNDPFNKPDLEEIFRVRTEGRGHTLITDGSTLVNYNFSYIRKPEPITLTTNLGDTVSDLADHVHRELLETTVELALKVIEQDKKLQIEKQTNLE